MDMYNPKDTSVDYSIMGVSRDTNPASLCTLLGKPSNKNTYSGVTDIRYEADVIKSITGDGYESSVPVKLPTLAVVILLVGVTGGICRVLWRQKRTQEILNTPLDELADSVLKKYGEEDDA